MTTFDIDALRTALRAEPCRIDLGFAFGSAKTMPTARVWSEGDTARKHALPLILPPEGGSRADLLRLLADLVETDGSPS